ncbi:recombinase family protein [Caballeronia sp. LjRoot31]|uniref:recombinase family protein n=1 Tax=Caballeronia sp. LjRoot31 TaxID=3342324 RepID=UPI003ECE2F8E
MARTFLYARVSTADQSTDNQVLLAERAGYAVESRRVHAETISGTVPAMERPQFAKVVSKLEQGDVLVVAKLDRLGRNASDIDRTVEMLRTMGVRVVVLDLPVMEVTSAAGDLVRRMFAAFAQFERDQLVERTHAGLARAKAEGKVLGRRDALAALAAKRGIGLEEFHAEIRAKLAACRTARGVAKEYGVTHPTIMKVMQEAT